VLRSMLRYLCTVLQWTGTVVGCVMHCYSVVGCTMVSCTVVCGAAALYAHVLYGVALTLDLADSTFPFAFASF
jgi:hypothetical protein